MNHVVHRQFCYTLFTQVPIEHFFQLGLDFLFAGSYLVNWVAGVKLIFIFLLAVILVTGTEAVRIGAVVSMILSIATYFWRLHPTIKKLDAMGCITPKGYSKALGWMIAGFMVMFTLALILHILTKVM